MPLRGTGRQAIVRQMAIIFAALALCALGVALHARHVVSRIGATCDLAIRDWEESLVEQQRAREQARLDEQDAEVQDATRQWADIIAQTARELDNRDRSRRETSPAIRTDRTSETKKHWAFRRLQKVAVPDVSRDNWARNPIDHFILARLEQADLQPRPAAPAATLARRLRFDIVGLPPTPGEIRELEHHEIDDQLVDRLLANTAFGEHHARAWLDLARYADSNGYEEDEVRPHAHAYRDFVIWALNHDLPFDDFIRWQLAGDELDPHNPLAVAATGFLTAAPYNTFLPQESERWDELDDMVSTMGAAMLGLSLRCARCHDHPYDNISSEEYYGLVAIFHPTRREQRYLVPDGGAAYRRLADPVDQRRAEIREMLLARVREDRIADLDFTDEEKDLLRQPIDPENERQIRLLSWCGRCLTVDDSYLDDDLEPLPRDKSRYDLLMDEIERMQPSLPPRPPLGLAIAGSEVVEVPLLHGGSLANKGSLVGPRFLSALAPDGRSARAWQQWSAESPHSGPRSALANWATELDSGAGPLLARVMVNRIWQRYFGRGLVATPSDFGSEGQTPTHPELLEWLAGELVQSGWSQKHIHRLILCSATYRQDTNATRETIGADPENRLCARRTPKRLTAEMYRDALLRLAGNLNTRCYGPPFQPSIPREAIFNRDGDNPDDTWPTEVVERPEVWRRSVYILIRRTNPVPLLQLLDAPDGTLSCDQRRNTTVPTQALALMNDAFVRGQATRIAQRVAAEYAAPRGKSTEELVERLFALVLARSPDSEEITRAAAFLRGGGDLTDLCHVLLMSNEFLYVD